MNLRISRRRIVAGTLGLLLVAGVTAGGAFVTMNSTIFDNQFSTGQNDGPGIDGELLVSGDPISRMFTGQSDGETASGYFLIENTSTSDMRVNIGSQLHLTGVNPVALGSALNARVIIGQSTLAAGTLGSMALAAEDAITLPAGTSLQVRIDIFIEDSAAFREAGLVDSEVTADFLFNSIATESTDPEETR